MLRKKLLSLTLALALVMGLTLPALAADTAAVIRLTKTTGTVEISKSSGKSVSLLKNMRLYSGYHVETGEESYAWINLDNSKLMKEDAASEVEVRKDGKKLEVLLCSGNIFFDVSEPLEDDESLNIHTSTTVVGIRGTSGWVEITDRWTTRVSILEGEAECSVMDPVTNQIKAEPVRGGERVTCVVHPQEQDGDKCDILREKFTVEDIPGFALTDLTRDIPLCDKIEQKTGLDIPRDLASVAGGDPSGRTPEGDSATKEVLDESDRREDEDEDDLHDRIEEVEKELEKQPDSISPSKPVEKPAAPAPETPDRDDDDDSSDSGSTPTPTPPEPTPDPDPDPDPDPGPDPEPDPDPDPEPDPEPTPPEPTTYSITFNANGGIWGTDTDQTIVQTNPDGTVTFPENPVYGDTSYSPNIFTNMNGGTGLRPALENQLSFDDWYDAPIGGRPVDASTVFSADATIYAHWDGWFIDGTSKTLVVTGNRVAEDYRQTYVGSAGAHDYVSTAPWGLEIAAGTVEAIEIKQDVDKIGAYAFWGGGLSAYESALARAPIPGGVTSIGYYAFAANPKLESANIPKGVTSIGAHAFFMCSGLTSVDIPEGVTSIGSYAFYNCQNLQTVNFGGTAAKWTALIDGEYGVVPDTATVFDKDGTPIP